MQTPPPELRTGSRLQPLPLSRGHLPTLPRLLCWSQRVGDAARDSTGHSVLILGLWPSRPVDSPLHPPSRHLQPPLCSEAFLTRVTAATRPCPLECWGKKKPSQGKDPLPHNVTATSFPVAQSHPLSGACSPLISLLSSPPFPFLAPSTSLCPPASHVASSHLTCREAAPSFAPLGWLPPNPQIDSRSPACSGAFDQSAAGAVFCLLCPLSPRGLLWPQQSWAPFLSAVASLCAFGPPVLLAALPLTPLKVSLRPTLPAVPPASDGNTRVRLAPKPDSPCWFSRSVHSPHCAHHSLPGLGCPLTEARRSPPPDVPPPLLFIPLITTLQTLVTWLTTVGSSLPLLSQPSPGRLLSPVSPSLSEWFFLVKAPWLGVGSHQVPAPFCCFYPYKRPGCSSV